MRIEVQSCDNLILQDITNIKQFYEQRFIQTVPKYKNLKFLKMHSDKILCIAAAASRLSIFFGGEDYYIRQFSIEKAKVINLLIGHTNKVTNIAITNNESYLVSSSSDLTVRIWSLKLMHQMYILPGLPNEVIGLTLYEKSSHIILALSDSSIFMCDMIEPKSYKQLLQNIEARVVMVYENLLFFGTIDNEVIAWDMNTNKASFAIDAGSEVSCLDIYLKPSKTTYKIILGKSYGDINFWKNTKLVTTLSGHQNRVTNVMFLKNYRHIVSSSLDLTVRIWSIKGRSQIRCFTDNVNFVIPFRQTSNELIASVDDSFSLCVRRANTFEAELKYSLQPFESKTVVFTDQHALWVSGNTIKVSNLEAMSQDLTLTGHSSN
jgi:WD40 repeat protein